MTAAERAAYVAGYERAQADARWSLVVKAKSETDATAYGIAVALQVVAALACPAAPLPPLPASAMEPTPVPMVLHCPDCRVRHIDESDFATKPHHTHSCQSCGLTWRPAVVATVGVQFLPGFKNEAPCGAKT